MYILSLFLYLGALSATLLIYLVYMERTYKNKYVHLLVLLCLGLPFALVAGFRNGVGTDYYNYLNFFQATASQSWSNFFSWPVMEPGYKFLVKIAALISDTKEFLFFVASYVTVETAFVAFYKLRKKLDAAAAITLYYLIAFHPSLNIIRQMMAVSMLLLMVAYLLENNYIGAVVSCAVAFLFHTTAAIGLLFIAVNFVLSRYKTDEYGRYISNKRATSIYYLMLLGGTLAMPLLAHVIKIIPFLSRYSVYLAEDPDFGLGTIFNFILLLAPSLVLLNEFIDRDRELDVIKNILVMYLPISMLGYSAPWASRLNVYTICMLAVYIPLLEKKTRRWRKTRRNGRLLTRYYWGFVLLKYAYEILYQNYNHTFPYFR